MITITDLITAAGSIHGYYIIVNFDHTKKPATLNNIILR